MLRHEVQHLPELHFTSAPFLLCLFTLSDVDHSTGVLNEIAARAEYRMTYAVNVPDGAAWMHNAIIHFLSLTCYANSLLAVPGTPVDRRDEFAG